MLAPWPGAGIPGPWDSQTIRAPDRPPLYADRIVFNGAVDLAGAPGSARSQTPPDGSTWNSATSIRVWIDRPGQTVVAGRGCSISHRYPTKTRLGYGVRGMKPPSDIGGAKRDRWGVGIPALNSPVFYGDAPFGAALPLALTVDKDCAIWPMF